MGKIATIFFIMALCFTCADGVTNSIQELWINSHKVPCEGVAPMQCLQIQKGDSIDGKAWQLFYTDIEGFDYEPGNIYKIRVQIDSLEPATLTADASSLKYSLVEVLSKNPDPRLKVNNIWVLEEMNGETLDLQNEEQRPRLEIQIAENKILGRGICNRFFGSIEELTENKLSFTEGMGSTKIMCPNIEIEDAYFKTLSKIQHYTVDNDNLILRNAEGKELLNFKRSD